MADEIKYHQMLLSVQDSLRNDDLQDLIFLCSKLLCTKELGDISSATDLFSLLQKSGHLSSDFSLLLELLTIIKQHSLIRKLGLEGCMENNDIRCISPYRRLLFELSHSITKEDLKNIKFILSTTLSRKTLHEEMTLLQVFLELEKNDLLDENNVEILHETIGIVCPALKKKIIQYQLEATAEMLIAQETENNTSLSVQSSPATSVSSGNIEEQVEGMNLNEDERLDSEIESLNLSVHENPEILQYEMKGDRRGLCLIINNYNFTGAGGLKEKREGTNIDKESLMAVFSWLGFEIRVEEDCDKKQILEIFKDLGSYNHTQSDCVVCCVLSHGNVDGVYGVDGEIVPFKDLKEPLQRSSSLYEKPKLFFIQACRGTETQRAMCLPPQNNRDDEMTLSDAVVPTDSRPEAADFLLAMSTVPHYVSFRDKTKGSWFIQSLCKNLKQMVPRGEDLLSILTKVNDDVSKKSYSKNFNSNEIKKQMPQPEFTLTKKLVFPIPATNIPE